MTDDIPQSIRIRTGDGNEFRYRAIDEASDFYDCNKSDAAAYACHDIVAVVEAVQDVVARDDLTLQQRREIVATFDQAVHAIDLELDEPDVNVDVDR